MAAVHLAYDVCFKPVSSHRICEEVDYESHESILTELGETNLSFVAFVGMFVVGENV